MKSWRITFKDGTSEQQNNWHHLTYGERYILSELIAEEEEIETGFWLWKKKETLSKEVLHKIAIIPKENILKAELLDFMFEQKPIGE